MKTERFDVQTSPGEFRCGVGALVRSLDHLWDVMEPADMRALCTLRDVLLGADERFDWAGHLSGRTLAGFCDTA